MLLRCECTTLKINDLIYTRLTFPDIELMRFQKSIVCWEPSCFLNEQMKTKHKMNEEKKKKTTRTMEHKMNKNTAVLKLFPICYVKIFWANIAGNAAEHTAAVYIHLRWFALSRQTVLTKINGNPQKTLHNLWLETITFIEQNVSTTYYGVGLFPFFLYASRQHVVMTFWMI